jgi:hypothetical protein
MSAERRRTTPGRSAVARGLIDSVTSRGRTERAAGAVAAVAVVVFLGAAFVRRWGADWEPQPLDADRDHRAPRSGHD